MDMFIYLQYMAACFFGFLGFLILCREFGISVRTRK